MEDFKSLPVSLSWVFQAKSAIAPHLSPTPLRHYPGLSRLLGCQVYVKHENHNPTGCFKIRGAINAMRHLVKAGVPGVVTFSTGNHGAAVAMAAATFGLPAVVVAPEGANPVKTASIRNAGAELVEAGADFEAAGLEMERIATERGYYPYHPAGEPLQINGVGTAFLEIAEQLPDLDALILPLGVGTGAAGACAVLKTLNPRVEIIAVQAEESPAAYLSWKVGRGVSAPNRTFAGGVATGAAHGLPFALWRNGLSDFWTLSEEELYEGMALAMRHTANLVEAAGAAPLAAAFAHRERLAGKKVVLQFSGGNASPDEVCKVASLACLQSGLPGQARLISLAG